MIRVYFYYQPDPICAICNFSRIFVTFFVWVNYKIIFKNGSSMDPALNYAVW